MFDQPERYTYKGTVYLVEHGSPFDRGSADSYYGRPREPHKYPNGTGTLPRVDLLTAAELAEYHAGYSYNEEFGDKKSYY